VVFEILIFPQNNKTIMLKRSKNIFLIFGTRQGLTLVLRIPIQNEKSGLHCSLKDIWKTIEKNDLISWK